MKKIKSFLCVALFGAISFGAYNTYNYFAISADDSFTLENIEALTMDGESGVTKNTGPGKTYDCPGWGTGDGKMCMCAPDAGPCTEIPC